MSPGHVTSLARRARAARRGTTRPQSSPVTAPWAPTSEVRRNIPKSTADVVSIATNATVPYIHELPHRAFVVLHLSLRDLAPDVVARCYNIVDDIEHVCTARTSLHLASEAAGHRDFIRATMWRDGKLLATGHDDRKIALAAWETGDAPRIERARSAIASLSASAAATSSPRSAHASA